MKINKITFWVLGLAALAVSCVGEKPSFGKEEYPAKEYVRLTIMSGCGYNAATADSEATRAVWDDANGSGSLILKWEEVDIASDRTDELALILSDGEKPISGKISPEAPEEVSYSGVAVTPQEGDAHHADLQTVLYYNSEDLQKAKYCYAVAGNVQVEERADNEHIRF